MCWQNDAQLESPLNLDRQIDLDYSYLERFLREHADHLCLVRLHGGEPFHYREILPLIDLLNELKIPFNAPTNGSCLNEEIRQRLVGSYCVSLGVSMDAATPETYARIRKGGDFKQVLSNVDALNTLKEKEGTRRPLIGMSMCTFTFNVHEMAAMVRLCADHGIPALSVAEGGDLQTGDITPDDLLANHVEMAHDAIREAAEEAKRCGVILRTRFPSLTQHSFRDIPYHAGGVKPKNCLNLYTTFWMLPDLEVIGCSHVNASAGNLRDASFSEIWNAEDHWYVQARRSFRMKEVPDACSECGWTGKFVS
jgi:MoaA/NifB/PqqE/SkfB family radical SAM enzyme